MFCANKPLNSRLKEAGRLKNGTTIAGKQGLTIENSNKTQAARHKPRSQTIENQKLRLKNKI
jgi:hypothetical protein